MAEVLVTVLSEALLNKLISIAFKEINGVWGVKDELKKLYQTLVSIKAVLTDAGKKQVKEEAIRLWLRNLNDVAYDIEDIFDAFEYERLKLEIKGSMQNKVRNFFTHLNLPLAFRLKMAHKIKDISKMLDLIAKDIEKFKFVVEMSTTVDNGMCIRERPETSSHVIESEIVGRELDKLRIIDLLINSSNGGEIYSVVRIVGIGGLGKTTLAQLVYNDKSVIDHFGIKVWACVSQYSNEKEIYHKLLESIDGEEISASSLDVMVNRFKKSLGKKRYLIVLDDVWNNGTNINWEKLLTDLLSMGAQGSKLLVTARSDEDIPSIMAMGAIYTHRLVGLTEEECWSLFERIAFGHGGAEKTPTFDRNRKENCEEVWRSAASCKGPEEFDVEERNKWGDVKSYKMHDLALSINIGIECSMMDISRIQKEEITRLRRVRLVSENELSSVPKVMYEARKLRTFVTSNLTYQRAVVLKVSNDMFSKLSCLRVLDLSHTAIQELPASIGELKHLRYFDLSHTKLKTLPDSCTNLYHLQTLRLKCCYSFENFPNYMRKLVNLKYLIFSGYESTDQLLIRKVGKLSQLQKLSKFVVGKDEGFGIEELKDLNLLEGKLEIHNLENVRDARGANLKEKQYIRSLELLRGYTYEVVEDDCAVFEGLQPNKNLKKLRIYGFAALNFPIWMTSASVDCLPNLISVTLECCCSCEHLPSLGQLPFLKFFKIYGMDSWKRIGSEFYRSSEQSAMRVAATNISFPSLKELYIECMSNLEEWLGDQLSSSFPCLVKLVINDCPKVKIAPALFPSLKTLVSDQQNGISLMSMVESNLASLTFIRIRGCTELKFLPQVLLQGNNVLGHLEIFNCKDLEAFVSTQEHVEAQQLQELSSNKSLHELSVRHCPSLKSVPDLWGFNSLRILTITGCGILKSLPDGIQCLPILEELSIGPFSKDLESFPFPAISSGGTQQHFLSLRVLSIHGWTALMSLPDGLQYLISLQELVVYNFDSLEALPEWLGNLTSLQTLGILYFNNLKYLPSQEQMIRLTVLQTLEIGGCPVLEKKCLSNDSDEARKTERIPHRLIEYTGPVYFSAIRDKTRCISIGNWVIKGIPYGFEGYAKRRYGGQEAADD